MLRQLWAVSWGPSAEPLQARGQDKHFSARGRIRARCRRELSRFSARHEAARWRARHEALSRVPGAPTFWRSVWRPRDNALWVDGIGGKADIG